MKPTLALFAFLVSSTAFADAIPGYPDNCPKGHEHRSDHSGSWCQPPAPKCAKGEHARPTRGDWYCEPPPPVGGCPAGSQWESRSRTDAWCDGQKVSCDNFPDQVECKKTALCVKEFQRRYTGRRSGTYTEERVAGVCGKKNSCDEGWKCVVAKRYVEAPPPKPAPASQPSKGALWLLPILAAATALGAAFRRRGT